MLRDLAVDDLRVTLPRAGCTTWLLRNERLTFTYLPATDTLLDSYRVPWTRVPLGEPTGE